MREVVSRNCRERSDPAQKQSSALDQGCKEEHARQFWGLYDQKKNQCFFMGGNYIGILPENKQKCILGTPHASNTSWRAHIFAYTTHMHMQNNFGSK
jgi:hypothetical protein